MPVPTHNKVGAVHRAGPAAVDAVLPEVFAFERYDGQDWLSTGDGVACTVKFGTAVVPRGVPLSLRLGLAGGEGELARFRSDVLRCLAQAVRRGRREGGDGESSQHVFCKAINQSIN